MGNFSDKKRMDLYLVNLPSLPSAPNHTFPRNLGSERPEPGGDHLSPEPLFEPRVENVNNFPRVGK